MGKGDCVGKGVWSGAKVGPAFIIDNTKHKNQKNGLTATGGYRKSAHMLLMPSSEVA